MPFLSSAVNMILVFKLSNIYDISLYDREYTVPEDFDVKPSGISMILMKFKSLNPITTCSRLGNVSLTTALTSHCRNGVLRRNDESLYLKEAISFFHQSPLRLCSLIVADLLLLTTISFLYPSSSLILSFHSASHLIMIIGFFSSINLLMMKLV